MNSFNSRGQALVEMAFVLFLLVLLVMGIFEFGRAMYIKNTLTHAARAGARAGVVTPGLDSPVEVGCNTQGIGTVIQTTCNNLYTGIDKTKVTVKVQVFAKDVNPDTGTTKTTNSGEPPAPGDTVKVTVTLNNYSWLFLPRLTKSEFYPSTLSGNTAMRYE